MKQQAQKNYSDFRSETMMDSGLVDAVIKQLDSSDTLEANFQWLMENLDSCKQADSGVNGFIYHDDTVAFFKANRKAIKKFLADYASEVGISILDLVANFTCLRGDFTTDEIAKAIYDTEAEYTSIHNALAWFCLESVANEFENLNADNEYTEKASN